MANLRLPEVNSRHQPESLENKKEQRVKHNLRDNHINFITLQDKKRLNKRNEIWKYLYPDIDILAYKFIKIYIKIKILILTSTFIFGQSTVYKFALIYQLFLILNKHIDMMKRSLYLITGNVTPSFKFRWKNLKSSSKFLVTNSTSKLKMLIVNFHLIHSSWTSRRSWINRKRKS